ncbi:MAG: hypothetical protein AB2A00_19255 [Myxococcota bacterium]
MTTTSPSFLPASASALLRRWFVRFNPLFTLSALCVLGGVFALSRAMGTEADVGLTVVLDLYQWLLIGSAALLYRRLLRRRPGAVLGIIQLVYMSDPTLQLSALASSGAWWASAVWLLSFHLKLRALAWAFQLRVSRAVFLLVTLGAAMVAGLPWLRTSVTSDQAELLTGVLPVCGLVVGILARHLSLTMESCIPLTGFGVVAFQRSMRAAWGIWGGAVVYHTFNALLSVGLVPLLPMLGAVALSTVLFADDEKDTWVRVGVSMFLCALAARSGFLVGLGMVAAVLTIAWMGGRPARFAVVAVGCAHVLIRLQGWDVALGLPEGWGLALVSSLAWGVLLVRGRSWLALMALVMTWGTVGLQTCVAVGVLSTATWGMLLLGMGFVLLLLGVVAHGVVGAGEEEGEGAPGPSTCAAVSVHPPATTSV